MVQSMNYKRDLERIETIIGKAKAAAWGPKMVPLTGQRKVSIFYMLDACIHAKPSPKVKVNVGGDAHDEDGYSNSRWIDMVVDGSDVYVVRPQSYRFMSFLADSPV